MGKLAEYREQWKRRVLRTVAVPQDLDSITDFEVHGEVDPRSVDIDPAAVDAIWQACQNLYRTGAYPLLSLCLRHRGEIVLNRSIGYSRDDRVASVDTPICLFSASKAVSAVLVHLLAEQDRVNLLNPVSYYIPAYAAKGKGSITIHQLLAHRGGVPNVPQDVEIDLLFDHAAALELVCASKPVDHQARTQAYHAITSGFVINELIKVTTGLSAQQYLDRYIRKPMGMRYFRYGLTSRDQAKAAINTTTGLKSELISRALTGVLGAHPDEVVEMTNDARFYRAIIPSANLFATAEEVSRFYQMLLNHGTWQGQKILDPLTVQRATRPQGRTELDRNLMMPMRYSAGFMLGGSPIGFYGRDTQYAYGHIGYANIFNWADPQREIAVGLMNTGKAVLGPHLKALPVLLGAISDACPPVADMDGDIPAYHRKA